MAIKTRIKVEGRPEDDIVYRSVIPLHLLDRLVELEKRTHRDISELVEEALADYVRKKKCEIQPRR